MKTKNNYLITGVSLIPDRDENTLFYARKLADLLSLKLRLVHTLNINEVQPWVNFAGYPPVSYVDQSESWEKIRSDANDRLSELADSIAVDGDVDSVLCAGMPEDCLIEEAKKSGAVMIAVGATASRHRFVPSGFSVAIGLMSASPIPVLVINNAAEVDLDETGIRLLVADDLREFSDVALESCAAIARVLPKTEIKHVHVTGSKGKLLIDAVRKYWETIESLISKDVKPGDCFEQEMRGRQEVLDKRASEFLSISEVSNVQYGNQILSGDTGQEVLDAAQRYNPHLMIFGQHHAWRKDKQGFGSLKHWEMIEYPGLSLIIPNKCLKLCEHMATHIAD